MHITEIRNHTKLLHSYVIRRLNVARRRLQAYVYQYNGDLILRVLWLFYLVRILYCGCF